MKKILVLILAMTWPVWAKAREVALTFDDCPRDTHVIMDGMERAHRLVAELKKAGVKQAAFFCNSPDRQPNGQAIVQYYNDAGHLIANHSGSHPDLAKITVPEYLADIAHGDEKLRGFSGFRKWFRFPFLHEGRDPQTVEAVRAYLKQTGYRNGYVTIDSLDYYVDYVFAQGVAAGKTYDARKLCGMYRDIMVESAAFFDRMSVRALGRSVKHVILMHETDLNALCVGEVVKGLRRHGWKIISPDEAFADPIAAREPSAHVKFNQGRIFALAAETDYRGPWYGKWDDERNVDREFLRRGVFK